MSSIQYSSSNRDTLQSDSLTQSGSPDNFDERKMGFQPNNHYYYPITKPVHSAIVIAPPYANVSGSKLVPATAPTNPSKRHRERLNTELDRLSMILPFDTSIISKLDKLSILRLTVSYIRIKAYFNALIELTGKDKNITANGDDKDHKDEVVVRDQNKAALYYARTLNISPENYGLYEKDLMNKALIGFLLILNSRGDIFYVSQSVENFLGFHQSDILHQSVYELIHSEDRDLLKNHLNSANSLNQKNNCNTKDDENIKERIMSIRFRCLLDNASGFVRLEIRGRLRQLHGNKQSFLTSDPVLKNACKNANSISDLDDPMYEPIINFRNLRKLKNIQFQQENMATDDFEKNGNGRSNKKIKGGTMGGTVKPYWGFFGLCMPTARNIEGIDGSPAFHKENSFKVKHKLDLSVITIEQRGRNFLGIPDGENAIGRSFYGFVHPDDLSYVSLAHYELIKSGVSSLGAYRLSTDKLQNHWQWVQTNFRLLYKNGIHDYVLASNKPLLEEEGRDLFGKRKFEYPQISMISAGLISPGSKKSIDALILSSNLPNPPQNGDLIKNSLFKNCSTVHVGIDLADSQKCNKRSIELNEKDKLCINNEMIGTSQPDYTAKDNNITCTSKCLEMLIDVSPPNIDIIARIPQTITTLAEDRHNSTVCERNSQAGTAIATQTTKRKLFPGHSVINALPINIDSYSLTAKRQRGRPPKMSGGRLLELTKDHGREKDQEEALNLTLPSNSKNGEWEIPNINLSNKSSCPAVISTVPSYSGTKVSLKVYEKVIKNVETQIIKRAAILDKSTGGCGNVCWNNISSGRERQSSPGFIRTNNRLAVLEEKHEITTRRYSIVRGENLAVQIASNNSIKPIHINENTEPWFMTGPNMKHFQYGGSPSPESLNYFKDTTGFSTPGCNDHQNLPPSAYLNYNNNNNNNYYNNNRYHPHNYYPSSQLHNNPSPNFQSSFQRAYNNSPRPMNELIFAEDYFSIGVPTAGPTSPYKIYDTFRRQLPEFPQPP